MNDENPFTVKEFADIFNISVSSVYSLIRRQSLNADKVNNKLLILRDEKYSLFVSKFIEKLRSEPYDEAFFPDELTGYRDWHQTLDYLSWLFKISYSKPKDIKKRKFNIRNIFDNYLDTHNVELELLERNFSNNNSHKKLITDDLKRGWYNELAYIYPLKEATLGISFREISRNIKISSSRFSFPSWKITEGYYSTYFYLRSITQFKNPHFKIEQHKSTLNAFKNNTLDSLKRTIWKFPLDLEYRPKTRFYISKSHISNIDHVKYNYSKHPRTPYLSPIDITKEVQKKFRTRGKSFARQSHYTIFDFLLEFRVWANYLDIDNLLSLYGEGYKAYLDQNLSILYFFIGGFTELIFISVYGEDAYLCELQNLYDLFAKNNEEIKHNFIYSSIYQRMKIFKIRNYILQEIKIDEVVNENEITE